MVRAIHVPNVMSPAPVHGGAASDVARLKIKKIFSSESSVLGTKVKVQGWVRTLRDQKNFAFISINDGSCLKDIQVIAEVSRSIM